MGKAREGFAAGMEVENFAAPDGAVGAVARAIADEGESALREEVVLGEDGGGVGVVMLDGDEGDVPFGGKLLGVTGAGVGGMKVVSDPLGADIEEFDEVFDGTLKMFVGEGVFEIAEVLGENDFVAAGSGADDGDGVFEFAADTEAAPPHIGLRLLDCGCSKSQSHRGVAAGAADGEGERGVGRGKFFGRGVGKTCLTGPLPRKAWHTKRAFGKICHARGAIHIDGVVDGAGDGAVVEEEGVAEWGEAAAGFVVVVGDGFVADVAGGHDERWDGAELGEFGEEEMLDRGVGEHDAEAMVVGGDFVADCCRRGLAWIADGGGAFGGEDDGAAWGGDFGLAGGGEVDEELCGGEVGDHEGEGFGVAAFEVAEAGDGGGGVSTAGEVEAAEAFDGEDSIREENCSRFGVGREEGRVNDE